MYYTSMSSLDCDSTSIRQLEWLHGRLIKQKRDEQKAAQDAGEKKSYRVDFRKGKSL